MDHELIESSLQYHGTYLLDQLRGEQQVSIDDDLSQWFQNHLPHTVSPKLVPTMLLYLLLFCIAGIFIYKLL